MVGGRYRGVRGVLEGVDVDAFLADVRLVDAPHEGLQARGAAGARAAPPGRVLRRPRRAQVQLEYEHVCKTEAQ